MSNSIISENNDLNTINFVAGLSDPGEMIRCGYLPEIRRRDGEQDAEYQARILPIVMALPKAEQDKIMKAAQLRAGLDTSTGKVAMFAAETPGWHGLGKVIAEAATSEEAIQLAVLDWVVEKQQLCLADGTEVPGAFATVRTDTGKALGVVGSRYVPFQNSEAFAFLDALVGEGLARYETAGSLDGGKQVWMLLRLPREVQVGENDRVIPYVLLTNSHDGSSSIRVVPTSIRVACKNTKNLALRQDGKKGLFIRHTKNVMNAVAEAREAFGIVLESVDGFAEECKALAGARISDAQAREYLERLYPTRAARKAKAAAAVPEASVDGAGVLSQILDGADAGREVVSELLAADAEEQTRTQKRNAKIIEEILANYASAKNNLPGTEKTMWSLVNATTERLDHQVTVRGKTAAAKADNRLSSNWFGTSAERKDEAWDLALELVQAGGAKMAV